MKLCFAILCMNLIAATRAEGGLVFAGMGHEDLAWFLLEKGAMLSNIRLNPLVKPRSKGLDTFVNSLLGTYDCLFSLIFYLNLRI